MHTTFPVVGNYPGWPNFFFCASFCFVSCVISHLSDRSFVTFQMSVIVQEMLRVFIIRIACLNIDYASQLVKPIVSWISDRLLEPSVLSDVEAYKVISKTDF